MFLSISSISVADAAPVSFSAFSKEMKQYDYNELVIFSGVINNIGNHYDPDNSTFTCPYNGLYIFSVNVNAYSSYEMVAAIEKDDEYLVEAWASDNGYSQAAAFTVTECNVGQKVLVRGGSGNNCMDGDGGRRHSVFTGALLYAYV